MSLFWTSYPLFSSHPMLHRPVHDSETTDSVRDIVHIGKEAQRGVSAAVRACDMKMFSVVSLPSTCLIIAIVTYARNV